MPAQKSMNSIQHEGKERKCPECGSDNVAYEGGELVCKKCGLVIE